jgi:hypothetical protein
MKGDEQGLHGSGMGACDDSSLLASDSDPESVKSSTTSVKPSSPSVSSSEVVGAGEGDGEVLGSGYVLFLQKTEHATVRHENSKEADISLAYNIPFLLTMLLGMTRDRSGGDVSTVHSTTGHFPNAWETSDKLDEWL